MDKESLIAKALLAHSMERYHDLLQIMPRILAIPLPLGALERKLLHDSYKMVCETQYRSLLKLGNFYERNIENLTIRETEILRSYFIKIRDDLVNNCNEITDILRYYLIPAAMIVGDIDTTTFYLCMKGNHHTYAAEFAVEPHVRKVSINEAQTAYEESYRMAQNSLPAVNSTRLRTVINYSGFICNTEQDLQRGCLLLREELRNYELERQTGAEISAASAVHIKQIRDNLSLLRRTLMGMIFPEYEYNSSNSSDGHRQM